MAVSSPGPQTFNDTPPAREAAQRDWILARHDLLTRQIALHANATGWNRDLIQKVDGIFLAGK